MTHPSLVEKLQAQWQADVTQAVNQIEQSVSQLVPSITLSDEASAIGLWLSQTSEVGREDGVTFDEITAAFPDATKQELEDASGELELAELVTLSGAIGHRIRIVRPQIKLFEVFDPAVFDDANPRADAAKLARYILAKNDTVGAEEAMAHLGWSVRRFNPAIGIVCSMIGRGRKSEEIHPTISCPYVMPDPRERAELRRFADAVLGPQ